jgi:hypothetical protein
VQTLYCLSEETLQLGLLKVACILQFNLENEEVECAQREVELWRRDPSCPLIIEARTTLPCRGETVVIGLEVCQLCIAIFTHFYLDLLS